MDKTLVDPVLTAQVSNGFVLKQLIPNYFSTDSESRGYATFLEWTNLDYTPHERRQFRAVSTVRLGVVQYEMRPVKSFEEFATQCEFFIDVASDYKADFVLFPALLTSQLLPLVEAPRPGLAARKLSEFTERYLELFTKLAIRYNVNIVGYDVEFPELARIAADQGAQILFVPFKTDGRDAYLRVRYCAQARCIENHVFAAIAGCVGNLPFVENADIHYAQSGILTPSDVHFSRDGIAEECTPNIETVIMHDVDLELLKRHRVNGTVQNWRDRRADLYSLRYRDGKGERTAGEG